MSTKGQRPAKSAISADTFADIAKELSKFSCISYLDDVELSDDLLSGSIKSAAVIACSDMGCLVPYVCSSTNVRLFLFQNFGHEFTTGGFVETVVESGVGNVVVYGHSDCEYTRFLARSGRNQPANECRQPSQRQRRFRQCFDVVREHSESFWEEVGQFNVLSELKRMLADPLIGPRAARGELLMHGWFYRSATHQLQVFDPRQLAFTVPHTSRSDRCY